MAGEIASILLLAAVLAVAVVRPRGLPEALVAVPAAGVLVATGVLSLEAARDELDRLWPVLAFLAAVLVLARLCAAEGLFDAAGRWLSRSSGGRGPSLLTHVVVLAVVTTSMLSLDATVLLLTPVVLAAAGRLGVPARAHVYATGRLSNSGSLLLPMANLTNLLAVAATGLTLLQFAAAMALPLLAAVAVEYLVLSRYFRSDLAKPGHVDRSLVQLPRMPVAVLALTLIGFVAASIAEVEAYWVAIAAAVVLGVHAFARGFIGARATVSAVDLPFLFFVAGLALVVRAVVDGGLGTTITNLLPDSTSLLALIEFAVIATVLANVVNNLPALLILLAPATAVGTLAVLAVLIGVNIGPNLTYPGSLATLLWKRVLEHHELTPSLRRYTSLGLLTVPAGVLLATAMLWVGAAVLPFV